VDGSFAFSGEIPEPRIRRHDARPQLYGDLVSEFSDHDPNGQAVRAAGGLTHYDRHGWRRWLVPAVFLVVVVAAVALAIALLVN
jgi:hypothetical protein